MKKIYNFNQFNKLNESDNKTNGEETPFRDVTVLVTLFASELLEHVKYWFSYGIFKDTHYELKSVKDVKSNIEKAEFWLDEFVSDSNEDPKYTWRVKYIPIDPEISGDMPEKRVSRVRLVLDVFSFSNQKRLKNYEVEIPVDKISAKKLKDKMNWLKTKIVSVPNSKDDISKFDRRQDRNLKDDAY